MCKDKKNTEKTYSDSEVRGERSDKKTSKIKEKGGWTDA